MWEMESQLALNAVKSVAHLLTSVPQSIQISKKSTVRDLVTSVDLEIEEKISRQLSTSKYPLLGEESYYKDNQLTPPPFWALDPIDGTLNFISTIVYYGTSLGLYTGQFSVGAVSLPLLKAYYYTTGTQAMMNGEPIYAHDSKIENSLIAEFFLGSAVSDANFDSQYQFHQHLLSKTRGVMRLGSIAAALCMVSSGRVQAVIGRNTEIWDAAGGIAVALQAGCKLWYEHNPLSTKLNFIVAVPSLIQELITASSQFNLMRK